MAGSFWARQGRKRLPVEGAFWFVVWRFSLSLLCSFFDRLGHCMLAAVCDVVFPEIV